MAETAAEIVPLWEQWDAAGRPIPPCPACGGTATHTAWTEGYNEGGPIADCDATRCDCGLQIRGYATCADATNMSGFQWWLLAMRFERQAAEITRLQSGGCARDQTTTQYCAEAAKFAAEIAELRAEVERLRALTTWRPTHRHVKRGSEYMIVGTAELQMSRDWLVDGSDMIVYRGSDGRFWCREETEFNDGRFELIAPPAPESSNA